MNNVDIRLKMIDDNKTLSEDLKTISKELIEITHESELYEKFGKINGLHDSAVLGGFEDDEVHTAIYSLPGGSIRLEQFELTNDLKLKIFKKVSVGDNTNLEVEMFAGHDYIAPSLNNFKVSIEEFQITDTDSLLTILDNVSQRTLDEQLESITDLDNVVFGNGEKFNTLLKIREKCLNENC